MSFPWRTLLFVSLGFNVLAVGAVAGAIGAGVRVEREQPAEAVVARMPGPRAFLGALPAETREVVRGELADSWVESREQRRAALSARREAFAVAAEEPYDAARVKAAFARLRQADQHAIGTFHDNVADAFATLTPEQRRDALRALRSAAPARPARIAPASEEAAGDGGDAAVQDMTPRERRQERRERRRALREQRLQQ